MLKNAITEIKLHPNRIIATLIAIAISIGFMAGSVTFISTLKEAMARSQNLPKSNADILIRADASVEEAIKETEAQDGVKSVAQIHEEFASYVKGEKNAYIQMYSVPGDDFAWARPVQGRWPNAADEVALSPQAAAELDARVGDKLATQGGKAEATLVGITNDSKQPFSLASVGYFPATSQGDSVDLVVKAKPGTNLTELTNTLGKKIRALDPKAEAKLAAEVREDALTRLTGNFDIMRNSLLGFSAIALIVGMIIIANTFNILVTQRRQQIGLLRAIGATGDQVRTQFLAEATIIGLLGSLLGLVLGTGVATIGAWYMNALGWGLSIPWGQLAAVLAVGILITVIAALAPSISATRVTPIEALRIVPDEKQIKRITRVRYMVCGILAAAGIVLVVVALTTKKMPIIWAIGGSALLALAVLGGSPIFIPWLIRGLGKVLGATGPTTRLAAANGVRNPSRSAATATALMLAVGLIVTLQVAVATTRTTAFNAIENRYPVPISVTALSGDSLSQDLIDKVRKAPGINGSAVIEGGSLYRHGEKKKNGEEKGWHWALAPGDQIQAFAPNARQAPPADNEAYVDPSFVPKGYNGEPQTITGPNGSVSLKLVASRIPGNSSILVSPTTLRKLVTTTGTPAIWMSTSPDALISTTLAQLNKSVEVTQGPPLALVSGSFAEKSIVEQVVNILLIMVSALLGVAVLIALVGVANTLGLSVIERRRESALLRALGMQRSKLRLMLLIEALLIAGVGTLVGVVAGAFFGWLGATTAFRSVEAFAGESVVYSIDPLYTAGLLLVAIAAAALASVLPGRRAANATPTEALAND